MNVSSWLKESPIDHLDSELIVAFVLGKDRTFVHAHPEYVFTEVELAKIQDFATRRGAGEPLAYIFGTKEFYGRNFRVTRDTLIPRPETEALIDLAKTLNAQKILDVGTGSGCIAITLALEMPQTEIEAVDISPKALEIAQENAKNLGAKVKFYQSDLLENTEKYDIIVANLPYVDKNWDWLGPELDYEPETALYADDGGLELIKKLINQAPPISSWRQIAASMKKSPAMPAIISISYLILTTRPWRYACASGKLLWPTFKSPYATSKSINLCSAMFSLRHSVISKFCSRHATKTAGF